jgi:hypothetical protein
MYQKIITKIVKKQVGVACVIPFAPTFEILSSSWDVSFQSSCAIPTNVQLACIQNYKTNGPAHFTSKSGHQRP